MIFISTLDRREALKDADFVTTQFRVGQLDAREKDELIPLKYGVIGQETNGPGGMFKALRTIPVIFDIIKICGVINVLYVLEFRFSQILQVLMRKQYLDIRVGKSLLGYVMDQSMDEQIQKVLNTKDTDEVDVKIGGINHIDHALDIGAMAKK